MVACRQMVGTVYKYHSKLDCSSLSYVSYEKGRASFISDQDDIIANKSHEATGVESSI